MRKVRSSGAAPKTHKRQYALAVGESSKPITHAEAVRHSTGLRFAGLFRAAGGTPIPSGATKGGNAGRGKSVSSSRSNREFQRLSLSFWCDGIFCVGRK